MLAASAAAVSCAALLAPSPNTALAGGLASANCFLPPTSSAAASAQSHTCQSFLTQKAHTHCHCTDTSLPHLIQLLSRRISRLLRRQRQRAPLLRSDWAGGAAVVRGIHLQVA